MRGRRTTSRPPGLLSLRGASAPPCRKVETRPDCSRTRRRVCGLRSGHDRNPSDPKMMQIASHLSRGNLASSVPEVRAEAAIDARRPYRASVAPHVCVRTARALKAVCKPPCAFTKRRVHRGKAHEAPQRGTTARHDARRTCEAGEGSRPRKAPPGGRFSHCCGTANYEFSAAPLMQIGKCSNLRINGRPEVVAPLNRST